MDNMLRICIPIILLCSIQCASPLQSSSTDQMSNGVKILLNYYSACRNDREPINCIKYKMLRLADRLINASSISIVDGISLVSRPGTSRSFSFDQEEEPIFNSHLGEEARESKIDSLIWTRLYGLIKSKSVQFDVPKLLERSAQLLGTGEEDDETAADGRGKKHKKKKSHIMMAIMMVKGTLIALMFKGLAFLAGTALVVSKIALVLASLIAVKKLFSSPPPEKTTYEIVKTPVVTHSHEYSHHGYSGADESSSSFGRSLEREEFEKRRLQTKGGHGKQESSPNTDLTNSKTPFYYINESDIKDETEGNTFSDIHSDDNNSLDADEAVYESANKWSPKLSETVEPLSTGQLSPYGYRSARVINTNSIDRMDQMSSEPSSTEINAIYRSRRGNKIFRAAAMPSSESAPSQNLRNSRMSKELKDGNEEAKQ